MLSRFHLIPERYGRTDGQICYINIAHQYQSVSQWNAGPATGRSALQDLRSCAILHGVVGVEPSVVLDLLHPRSAGSSSLVLPLRPDVRFTACTSVHSQA